MLEGLYMVQGTLCTATCWETDVSLRGDLTIWFKPVGAPAGAKLIRVSSEGRDDDGRYIFNGVEPVEGTNS